MSDSDACDLKMTRKMICIKTSTAALRICNGILAKPQVIGVNAVGRDLGGENGKIYLIALAKSDGNTYVFDLKLNPAIMKNGHLRYVLETITVIKVMHHARPVCLTAYKQFHLQIQNVFDTEIAHTIIEAQKLGCSPFEIELPSLSILNQLYGCGLKNPHRNQIRVEKNTYCCGHRPLSKSSAVLMIADATLVVLTIYEKIDQIICPCNRGLFSKLCSIKICADKENKVKQRQNQVTINRFLHQRKERLIKHDCPETYKKPLNLLCMRHKKLQLHHKKQKKDTCWSSPKHRSKICKMIAKTCSCKSSTARSTKQKHGKEDKIVRNNCKPMCSRGIQLKKQNKRPALHSPVVTTQCQSFDSNRPRTKVIRCYGHTENAPTSWQLVQVTNGDVKYKRLKKMHPIFSPDKQPLIKCNCFDVSYKTKKVTSSSSSVNTIDEDTDECMEFEADSEEMVSEEDEEYSDQEYNTHSEEE